jgi:hypothetical protein
MQTKTRKPYYKDEQFIVEYEIVNEKLFLHCDVTHFNSKVLRRMYDVFATMKQDFAKRGFAEMITVTPNPKFCELFNGQRGQRMVFNEKEYEVVTWALRQHF